MHNVPLRPAPSSRGTVRTRGMHFVPPPEKTECSGTFCRSRRATLPAGALAVPVLVGHLLRVLGALATDLLLMRGMPAGVRRHLGGVARLGVVLALLFHRVGLPARCRTESRGYGRGGQ